ncbi:hypothetical protein Thiowin_02055 [Thiorhodovibrio winogradskyi]|uniref:Uncharacterized protein n=1 Tax=Thiorhodovibrio winogradskyi TaxID=77007 RepID=A0ABZ0S9U6_9GAMM|nr:hypothetical protein [Thiorhodovibrio winogradskyi]
MSKTARLFARGPARHPRNRTLSPKPIRCSGTGLLLAFWIGLGLAAPQVTAAAAPELRSEGGWIEFDVNPRQGRVTGRMILFGTQSDSGTVFATLPAGTTGPIQVALQCMAVPAFQQDDQLTIPLGRCPAQGCALELRWTMDAAHWSPRDTASRLNAGGYRLAAADVLPRLTAAPHGLSRQGSRQGTQPVSPRRPNRDQATEVPADWQWVIRVADGRDAITTRRGRIPGMAEFADTWNAAPMPEVHDIAVTTPDHRRALALDLPQARHGRQPSSKPAESPVLDTTSCRDC